jgi:prepilin-type N-terminal cleavage/methylation domain-containing protein
MKRTSQAGFTMVELVITATVAAIIILTVIDGFTSIEQLNRTARAETIGTQVVQQEMEKVRNTPYANIATGATDLSSQLSAYGSLGTPRTFTKTVTVIDANGLKQVDFALSYTIYHRTKKIQLSTEVANIGINR